MRSLLQLAAPLVLALASLATTTEIVSRPGDIKVIPGWHLQSERHVSRNIVDYSQAGSDVSKWHRVSRRTTVMAGLIEAGVYDDKQLFFSDNLKKVPDEDFRDVSWLYREEFKLDPKKGQHYTLHTHGISSRADIYLNGKKVVGKEDQTGSFGGHKYDVTEHVRRGDNCVLIKAYATNYLRDLAIGYVDWNPNPPDNGTGVWRDVEFSQSGPVRISDPRIVTDFKEPGARRVVATVKTDVRNLGKTTIKGEIRGHVQEESRGRKRALSTSFTLKPGEEQTISAKVTIDNPKIWWPAHWGEQPLYTAEIEAIVDRSRSDGPKKRNFGIRSVTSRVNSQDTAEFKVNGKPFFIRGSGYTSDIFLRYSDARITTIFQYILDMGMNTVRLEGKQEHPELYDIADRMGLMIMTGWECCDHWEGWEYNNEGFGETWTNLTYPIGEAAMLHEAEMMQNHPSLLMFLVGSDFWPDDRATKMYVEALKRMDWNLPIVPSASKRGFPELLGRGGMKMNGPYDWVPPSYWGGDILGTAGAGGFGSELGPGVGTPEIRSLQKFLTKEEMDSLWTDPEKNHYHMSTSWSQFYNRRVYNLGLYNRYGKPTSLEDYSLKAQLMDYEAIRAEFEGYAAYQNHGNVTTGLIYWMLNSAWPNLHWAQFDYYLKPIASYFGTKVGTREEHVSYDYVRKTLFLINHSANKSGPRTIELDLIDTNGKSLARDTIKATTAPTSSKELSKVPGLDKIKDAAFLRLILKDGRKVLSRNIYWLSHKDDVLSWEGSTWFYTPVKEFGDLTAVMKLRKAKVEVDVDVANGLHGKKARVTLRNKSDVPAFFIRLSLLDKKTNDEVTPVFWEDNYVTLWPNEKLELDVNYPGKGQVELEVSGVNVAKEIVRV
ncbi:hypothetical protein FQN57_004376 [Myotisia sp. PD_48]|nr:hypothetical protein FQN57_004376 [Myotisia sp. PD_48]